MASTTFFSSMCIRLLVSGTCRSAGNLFRTTSSGSFFSRGILQIGASSLLSRNRVWGLLNAEMPSIF